MVVEDSNVVVFAEVDRSVANEMEGLVVDRTNVTGAVLYCIVLAEVPFAVGMSIAGVFGPGAGEVVALPFSTVPFRTGARRGATVAVATTAVVEGASTKGVVAATGATTGMTTTGVTGAVATGVTTAVATGSVSRGVMEAGS